MLGFKTISFQIPKYLIFLLQQYKEHIFKLEVKTRFDVLERIWESNMGNNLEKKDSEFVFKHLKFETVMEYHLSVN